MKKVCPECDHEFRGNGFDGIDAHWKANHESVMPYQEAWPLIRSGRYERPSGSINPPPVPYTTRQREEYERLMSQLKKQGAFL
jgi:hypothetical protein